MNTITLKRQKLSCNGKLQLFVKEKRSESEKITENKPKREAKEKLSKPQPEENLKSYVKNDKGRVLVL